MKSWFKIAVIVLPILASPALQVSAQIRPTPAPVAAIAQAPPPADPQNRAEIYYDVTMGHLYQQNYETSSKADDANMAVDFFKKAYALDPSSQVIGEQLATMYFMAQRTSEAVSEIQEMLRRDPSNLPARRLLARIYIRSLGDLSNATEQSHTAGLAIEQLNEIVRLDPTDADSAIWLARLERLSNQQGAAEKVLRDVLARDPQNETAAQQLAELLLDANRSSEAITLLEGSLKEEPSGALYDQLGDAYTQIHDPAHAAQAYRQAAELEPDQPTHLQGLAQSLFDLEDFPGARDQYEKLIVMQPNDPNNYLRLSATYRRLNQLDKAEQEVLLAKEHAPGNLEVIYNEALIYQDQGRFDDAVRVLSGAVAATKGDTQVAPSRRRTLAILYQLLGQIYSDADKTPSAIGALQEMAKLGPEEDRRARWLMVDTYRTGRDLPHAFEEARKGLKDYPDDRPLHISQALLYGENNQPDQAAEILKPLLDHSSADLEIYLNLAQIYEQARRFDDAEQSLHSAESIVTRPADRESLAFLFGGVYEREKKYDQAEQSFRGVLAVDPHNAQTLNYYGYMLADRGLRLDEAVSLLQRALAEDPTNPAYLDSLGWAYFKQDKLADAEVYLRRAVSREPHNPTLLSHLGDILAKGGYTDLAAAEWEMSLAEWHRQPPAQFETDKVAELEQKLSAVKNRVSQQKRPAEAKP
jgi:predicted Zn-dependent protease